LSRYRSRRSARRTHTEILFHDGAFAVVPFLREERNVLDVSDGVRDVRNALGDIDTITRADVDKLFLAVIILTHDDAIPVSEEIVFIEFWVIVIAPECIFVDELEVELNNRLFGVKGENTATTIPYSRKIA